MNLPVSTKPSSGMRDFLPADLARRRFVIETIRGVYERYGFVPLETPAIENLSILQGKYGEDEKLIYKLLHRGEVLTRALAGASVREADLADQALRYDLTVPLARVAAQYELPKFFKRYQIQPVWRADRPGRGRFREFYQCDVDITGTESLLAEVEVCAAVAEVLGKLGFTDYTLNFNHRALLRAMIKTAGIPFDREGTALAGVDKLDKIGADGVAAELAQRGIEPASAKHLLELVLPPEDVDPIDHVRRRVQDPAGIEALDALAELVTLFASSPVAQNAKFSPRLARGLSYYTGPIFEIGVPDLAGSLAGGGRYDELIGVFGKRKVPAVGCSIGLERILVVMEERGMYPPLQVGPQVLLCWTGVESAAVVRIVHRLRAQNLRVELFPEPAKLGKQLQYASEAVHAEFAAIVGEEELRNDAITLKHLGSGQQTTIAIDGAGEFVRAPR